MVEEKKRKPGEYLSFLDQYEDKVKSRLIFPLVALFLLCYVVYRVVEDVPTFTKNVSKIEMNIEPSQGQVFGLTSNATRSTIITIRDQFDNPMEDIGVKLMVSRIANMQSGSRPNCSTQDRLRIGGSYEAIRIFAACSIETENTTYLTDEFGTVVTNDLGIIRGPEGIYTMSFISGNVTSNPFAVYYSTEAIFLKVVTPQLADARYGVPLSPQPRVRVLSASGAPLANKRVVAMSWTEYGLEIANPYPIEVEAERFALLSGEISNFTDKDGYANFTNLTILASKQKMVYIVFVVDGQISTPWQDELDDYFYNLGTLPPRLKPPIQMRDYGDDYMELAVMRHPSYEVVEGEDFPIPPKFRIFHRYTLKPIVGVGCVAIDIGKNDDIYPRGFRVGYTREFFKYLKKPIAADWNPNYENPMIDWLFRPRVTDQNGEIEYPSLMFSSEGNIGNSSAFYHIKFRCGAAMSDLYSIKVNSRVASLAMKHDLGNIVASHTKLFEFDTMLYIKDKYGRGVAGKIVDNITAEMLSPSGEFVLSENASVKDMGYQLYEVISDNEGLLPIYLKFKYIVKGKYRLKILVDGVSLYTSTFTAVTKLPDNYNCNFIRKMISPYLEIIANETFYAIFYLFTAAGSNQGRPIKLKLNIVKTSYNSPISLVDAGVISEPYPVTVPVTTTNWTYTTPVYYFYSIYQGTYFAYPSLDPVPDDNQQYFCLLDRVLKLKVYTNQEKVVVTSNFSATFFDKVIERDVFYNVSIAIMDYYGKKMRNTGYFIYPGIEHLPPEYYPEFVGAGRMGSVFVDTNPPMDGGKIVFRTDVNGEWNFQFKLKPKAVGKWAIKFILGQTPISLFSFTTTTPNISLSIRQQPKPNRNASFQPVWESMDSFPIIQCTPGEKNGVLYPYTVTSVLVGETASDVGMMTFYGSSEKGPSNVAQYFSMSKSINVNVNTYTGLAEFTNFAVYDIKNNASCFRVLFVVGEPGFFVANVTSDRICFSSDTNITILTDYLDITHSGQTLRSEFKANISLPATYYSQYVGRGVLIVPYMINGKAIAPELRYLYAKKYLKNNWCLWSYIDPASGIVVVDSSGCSLYLEPSRNPTLHNYVFTFATFKWQKASILDNVRFKLTTFLGLRESTSTQTALFTNIPHSIEVVIDPPEEVQIGEIFRVAVRARLNDGTNAVEAYITANISLDISGVGSKKETENLLNILGGSKVNLEEFASIAYTKMGKLAEESCSAFTNIKGIAYFNLRFISGIPGPYNLLFKSGNVRSSATHVVKLTNPILGISLNNLTSQTFEIKANELGNKFKLPVLPWIDIKRILWNSLFNDTIFYQAHLVNRIYVDKAYEILFNGKGPKDAVSLANISQAKSLLGERTPLEKLEKLSSVVLSNGNAVGALATKKGEMYISKLDVEEVNSSFARITTLEFNCIQAGTYYVVLTANGIESKRSEEIIINVKWNYLSYFTKLGEDILTYLIVAAVVLLNAVYINKHFAILTGGLIILEILIVEQSSKGLTFQVESYITLSLLFIVVLHVFFTEVKYDKGEHFSAVRTKVFSAYTYALMYKRKEKPASLVEDFMQRSTTQNLVNESEKKRIPLKQRTMKEKIVAVLRPFAYEFDRKQKIEFAFYYPQRFLAAIFLGIVTFIYVVYKMIQYFLLLLDYIGKIKVTVQGTLTTFLSSSIMKSKSLLAYEFTDKNLSPSMKVMSYLSEQLDMIQHALYIAFIIGTIISVVVFSLSFLYIMYSFMKKITNLQGKPSKKYDKVDIASASGFPGNFISHCAFTYALFNIVFVLIFSPFCHPLLWKLVGQYWILLIIVIILGVVGFLIYSTLSKCIYGPNMSPLTKAAAHIFEFVLFFIKIIGGAASSLGRLIIGAVSLLISQIRVDKVMLPRWIIKYLPIDATYMSYLAVIKLYLHYNNPVAVAFLSKLLTPSHSMRESKKRIRNKLRLFWLHANPNIFARCRKGHEAKD